MLLKVLMAVSLLLGPSALAAGPPVSKAPSSARVKQSKKEQGKRKSKEERSEEEAEADAAEEARRKEKLARVVVLKWEGTSAGYTNDAIVRNTKSAISRPDAMFFPEVDLYQAGRKVKDRTVIPVQQPAKVPDSNVPGLIAEAEQTLARRYDSMSPAEWGIRAAQLREIGEQVWFVDRPELRKPLFMLYLAIGYAAENANHATAPFFEALAGT